MAEITPYNLAATPNVASAGDTITFTWNWDPTPQHSYESLIGRGILLQRLDENGNVIQSIHHTADLVNPSDTLSFPGRSVAPYYWEYRVYATQWQWDSANAGNEPLLGGPSNVVRVYDSSMPVTPSAPAYISVEDVGCVRHKRFDGGHFVPHKWSNVPRV